ncbi:MAG: NADH-quinone oxidoreductase subunit N, partial [Bacteroidales bacterium]
MTSYLDNLVMMSHELSLTVVIVLLFLFDLFSSERAQKHYHTWVCFLWGIFTISAFFFGTEGSAFGGMYGSDGMKLFVKNILNIGVLFMFMQAGNWLKSPETEIRRGEFYLITLFTLLGIYLMISARHFMLFYIGIELASVPLATLIAIEKTRNEAVEASAKYILSSVFASAILLFGISYLYGAGGSLYYSDMAAAISGQAPILLGTAFFMAGLFFKISVAPFHLWTADVYEGAPVSVLSYLSVVSKGAAAFVLMLVLGEIFRPLADVWQQLLWWLILLTITLGNLFAIRQQNLKRLFAFSSISQAGYLLLGVLVNSPEGMVATVYYLLAYLFSNFAAFGVLTAIESRTGMITLQQYNGLYKTNPRVSLVMMIALFSLAGIPPTAGFFSKFFT